MTSVEIPYSIAAALPTLSVMDITNDVSQTVARSDRRDGIAYVHPLHSLTVVRVPQRERLVASLLSEERAGAVRRRRALPGPVPADHALLARCRASQRLVIDLA